jgi:hypothetical protein
MNVNGTLLSCVGADRHDRTPISELTGGAIFITKGWQQNGFWEIADNVRQTGINN